MALGPQCTVWSKLTTSQPRARFQLLRLLSVYIENAKSCSNYTNNSNNNNDN